MVAPGAPDGLSAPAGGAPRGRFLPDQPIKIPMKRIQVLVVDDSAVVRQVVSALLAQDPEIEVMAAVADPILAMARMATQWPDVIVLDIEMPRMDGITFLKKIMAERPTPVVICSTLTDRGTETSLAALAAGAVAIITKPKIGLKQFLSDASEDLTSAVKAAAKANVRRLQVTSKHSADVILAPAEPDMLPRGVDLGQQVVLDQAPEHRVARSGG